MSMYKAYRLEPSIPHQCLYHAGKHGERCRCRAMHNEVMCFHHRIEDLPTVLQNDPFELTSSTTAPPSSTPSPKSAPASPATTWISSEQPCSSSPARSPPPTSPPTIERPSRQRQNPRRALHPTFHRARSHPQSRSPPPLPGLPGRIPPTTTKTSLPNSPANNPPQPHQTLSS